MQTTVKAKNGTVEVRTARRTDNRWESEYRFIPCTGKTTEWNHAGVPEGYVSLGMALSAGILLGRLMAEDLASHREHAV
ncbi:hypothetical protein D7S78_23795 [Ralstonia pickettii]|nr:hypothetical protein [Ralstonia pickettii]MBA9850931.1 hypothetical protein [Ralstonia pickettii]MBA9877817.1 hypothetical protein [Ralstonia pickettii]MBA9882382.1 hypothetical protein [Ralstonia pickettii]MBA9887626.1 hypothetical protein [Ralstonia pickettii]